VSAHYRKNGIGDFRVAQYFPKLNMVHLKISSLLGEGRARSRKREWG
jgi:hypothetical protein